MKKMMMIVAGMGMIGGAFADQSTSVSQDVTATVTNVCTYAVDSQQDVNGLTYTQANKDLGKYNALAQTDATVSMGNFYIFRCTSGTAWDTTPYGKTGSISLTNKDNTASKPLVVNYTVTTEEQADTVNGDIHSAGVNFTINKGQWQARSGAYKGNLSVTINYN